MLYSCNGATPTSDYRTAIGMLSSKAGGVTTLGAAYASVNYKENTATFLLLLNRKRINEKIIYGFQSDSVLLP